ncbi:MAG: AAA family ATPase, partial [Pseudomonadota bacterium]
MDHRPLTVIFVDLVGSTRLSQRLSAEKMLEINHAYQEVVIQALEQYSGKLVRVVGDGLLTLFGWPNAHGDDPERAVRAAMAIHRDLAKLHLVEDTQLACRIGIATGPSLVGDVQSGGLSQPGTVYGITPNLAARLQDLAGPGETVLAEGTRQRVDGVFHLTGLGPQTLNGFEEMQTAFLLTGETDRAGHQALGSARRRMPLIGRQDDLRQLTEKWALARKGEGQIVMLAGEPGIGKSRLMQAQRQGNGLGRHTAIVYFCSPFHQQSAYFPFIDQLERWCSFRRGDPPEVRETKLRDRIGSTLDRAETDLLVSVVVPEAGHLAPEMSELAFRTRLREIFFTLIGALTNFGPVLLHFEDVHWIDPSSRDLLRQMSGEIATMPVLMVLSQRQDTPLIGLEGGHVTPLTLAPLSNEEAKAMAAAGLENRDIGAHQVADLLALCNGVPLYIAEITAALLDRYEQLEDPGDLPIPGQVSELLMARLDSLGTKKPMALAASVIGRPFDLALLADVMGENPSDLAATIEDFCARGLFEPISRAQPGFTFSHNLLRETAYHSMVGQARSGWHNKVANALMRREPDLAAREPHILAQHCEAGSMQEAATGHWIAAAGKAFKRYAFTETLDYLARAEALREALPAGDRISTEMRITALAGRTRAALSGHGDPEAINAFDRAFEIAGTLGDQAVMLTAGHGLFTGYQVLADYAEAAEIGRRLASRMPAPQAQMWAHYIRGVPQIWRGRFVEAQEALAEASRNYALSASELNGAGRDLANQIQAMQGLVLAFLGEAETALTFAQLSIDTAEARGQPLALANVLIIGCNTHTVLQHPDRMALAQRLRALARQHKLPFYSASATSLIAAALYETEEVARGYEMLQAGWRAFQATTSRTNQVLACTELARGCLLLGRSEEGLSIAAEGLDRADRYDERHFEAELRRIRGELFALAGDHEKAREAILSAIDL